MAIDTKTKKLSVLNAGNPWPGPLFEPDGTIETGDKQHVLNLYSGITVESVRVIDFIRPVNESLKLIPTTGESLDRVPVTGESLSEPDVTGESLEN